MIDLYAAGTSNGMRARIGLEECGLAYALHPIDLAKGEHRTPQFLAMNPNGQIPVLVDNEGPGGKPVTLSQSSAILLYAAEKSGKFLPKDAAKRPAVWQALMSASTDITPVLGTVFGIIRGKDPHAPTADMFKGRLRSYFQVWDEALAKRKYAGGDEVSIADFSLYARWAGEIGARPAVQRALKF
jgi:GSH-dependent disulfide-bond oxidoreductase